MNAYNLVHGYLPGRVLKEFHNKNYLIGALDATYEQPKRFYHNLGHIMHMLETLLELEAQHKIKFSKDLYVAVLFHDIVYDIRATGGTNERYSVIVADEILYKCSYLQSFNRADVSRLIEATIFGRDLIESPLEHKLIADLDIANFTRFINLNEATSNVIREYETAYVRADVIRGRIDFLKGVAEQKHIYFSPYFSGQTEKARENLRLMVTVLEGS
jgi:predicted metal-dependent HD superfamily phosphohydrolase